MDWQPVSLSDLEALIHSAHVRMEIGQRRLWEQIRITPEKWIQHPWGDLGGGFWVVATTDQTVIWYNDIEEGFNVSPYTVHGTIDEYRCNQDELEIALQACTGTDTAGLSSP